MYLQNRLNSKEIYIFLIGQKEEQTSSRLYYQKKFNDSDLDWNIGTLCHKRWQTTCFSV